ncbi:MAG: DUF1330 domain-containing protein [Solirubrobacteraceae bacterium]
MKHYMVAELDVRDPSWIRAYVENVTAMVERRGGRYLARTSAIEQIEGARTPPQVAVLIEWPSKEIAQEFYDSEEYRPYRESRIEGASNEFVLIAGEDINKLARMS